MRQETFISNYAKLIKNKMHMNKDQPIFISFYTNNGKYPKKAKVLEKSLKDFNLR